MQYISNRVASTSFDRLYIPGSIDCILSSSYRERERGIFKERFVREAELACMCVHDPGEIPCIRARESLTVRYGCTYTVFAAHRGIREFHRFTIVVDSSALHGSSTTLAVLLLSLFSGNKGLRPERR